MKVFISWSGNKSHSVAIALRDWLPSVIQSIKPYVSSEDMDKGTRWSTDIAKELEDSSFGILCVTKDNLQAPWLSFEAGALSKAVDKSFVSPFLFDIKPSDLKNSPILQFQSTVCQKKDIKRLVDTLNRECGENSLTVERLDKTFEVWYPRLEEELNNIRKTDADNKNTVEEQNVAEKDGAHSLEILEEILNLSRENQKLLRNPEVKIDDSMEEMKKKLDSAVTAMRYNKGMYAGEKSLSKREQMIFLEDLIDFISPDCQETYGILILLNFYRDDFPWIYYMGKELIDFLNSSAESTKKHKMIQDFRRLMDFTFEHSIMKDNYVTKGQIVFRGMSRKFDDKLRYYLLKYIDQLEMQLT